MILNKKPQSKKKRPGPKPLTNLPPPGAPAPAPLPLSGDLTVVDDASEDVIEDVADDVTADTENAGDEMTIGSWEDLPAGDYLDPDENGTVWFKANDGGNWYQNGDGTWSKWQD